MPRISRDRPPERKVSEAPLQESNIARQIPSKGRRLPHFLNRFLNFFWRISGGAITKTATFTDWKQKKRLAQELVKSIVEYSPEIEFKSNLFTKQLLRLNLFELTSLHLAFFPLEGEKKEQQKAFSLIFSRLNSDEILPIANVIAQSPLATADLVTNIKNNLSESDKFAVIAKLALFDSSLAEKIQQDPKFVILLSQLSNEMLDLIDQQHTLDQIERILEISKAIYNKSFNEEDTDMVIKELLTQASDEQINRFKEIIDAGQQLDDVKIIFIIGDGEPLPRIESFLRQFIKQGSSFQ